MIAHLQMRAITHGQVPWNVVPSKQLQLGIIKVTPCTLISLSGTGAASAATDLNFAAVAGAIETWFAANARPMPWRELPTPWRSLVSEFMLQQTQVASVIERFEPFLERFPTPAAMAAASEQDVLALWQGMGYYRRARNLRLCAIEIVERFGGEVPGSVDDLMTLPGIGRYTAGAVASIAFGVAAPIVDGNVQRVIARLSGDGRTPSPKQVKETWHVAGALVEVASKPGVLNEGMMEVGATVCTPRQPSCEACPLQGVCEARRQGIENEIPPPRKRPARQTVHLHAVGCWRSGRLLLEKREETGLWAGLWQMPTVEAEHKLRSDVVRRRLGFDVGPLKSVGSIRRLLTHREVFLHVYAADLAATLPRRKGRKWVRWSEVPQLPVSAAAMGAIKLVGCH